MDWLLLVKIVIIYVMILLILKFMGKREIGQLSLFDFVVVLVIADFAVAGIESKEEPFYIYLIGIVLLGVIQKGLAFILLRVPKLRNILDGEQSLIMIDGKINLKEMKKQSYNIDDLVVQLRLKNIRSLSEVRYAILEANGELSVFKFSDFESTSSNAFSKGSSNTSSNTGGKTNPIISIKNSEPKPNGNENEIYPFPLIISGICNKQNLRVLNFTEDWLKDEIKKYGYNDIKNVYYANWENGKLFIVQTCNF